MIHVYLKNFDIGRTILAHIGMAIPLAALRLFSAVDLTGHSACIYLIVVSRKSLSGLNIRFTIVMKSTKLPLKIMPSL